jgi:hypothetical protein
MFYGKRHINCSIPSQNRFLKFLPNFDFPHCQEFAEFFNFLVKFSGQKIDGRKKIEIRF